MNRRDFLLLRTEAEERVADLACERLYMRFLDVRLGGPDAADAAGEGDSERGPVFDNRGVAELVAQLRQDLAGVDVLCLIDPDWLGREDFRRAIELVLADFEAAGGRLRSSP